jgi:arabinogalactan endo-1,4-beta-galactosidase
MHFSDTWADPGKQYLPSAWDNSSVETLAADLRSYVNSTIQAFTDGGVDIALLSLGNEITHGILWPFGKLTELAADQDFTAFATLWAAARAGVEDAVSAGSSRPEVMIHLDNGWKEETLLWYFEGLFATGLVSADDVDVFGFSIYPFYGTGATIEALNSSLTTVANTFNKPIHVAETDFPVSCTTDVALSTNITASAQGQIEWTQAIIEVLEGLPNGLGVGIFYWEPAFIEVASLGSACDSALLFSVDWTTWPATEVTALESVNMYL